MMVKRRKRKKKKISIKLILFLLLIIILKLSYMSEKKYDKRIEQTFESIKEKASKTKLNNTFIIKEENDLALLFVNKEEDKKIEGLLGIGEIEVNTPIRIYKKKFGYIDTKGKEITPLEFEEASDFVDGIAVVKKHKYGVIDEEGEQLLPFEYENILLGGNRRVILEKDKKYYFSDLKKGVEVDTKYIYQLDKEKIIFERDGLFGVMDFSGKILVPNEYEEISKYIDMTFIGKKGGKYYIYDFENNRKLTKGYDYIEQLDRNIYKGGTEEKGKYAFLSSDLSTEEKYEDIVRLDGILYAGLCFYGGIADERVDIFDENKGIISTMSIEEFNEKIESVGKNRKKE